MSYKGAGRSHACVPRRVNLVGTASQNECVKTTLMIRNVPNQYHRGHFMQELDRLGFCGKYDFVYLPIDRQTQWNVGYAFVNFESPEECDKCMKAMDGHKFKKLDAGHQQRYAQVAVAHLQGIEANLTHFQNTAVFSSGSGMLQPWVRPSSMPVLQAKHGEDQQQQRTWGHDYDMQGDAMQHLPAVPSCMNQHMWGVPSAGIEWEYALMQGQSPDGQQQECQPHAELQESEFQHCQAPDCFPSAGNMHFVTMQECAPDGCSWQAGPVHPELLQPAMPMMPYNVVCVPAEMVCAMDQSGAGLGGVAMGCGVCLVSPPTNFQPTQVENTDVMSVSLDRKVASAPDFTTEYDPYGDSDSEDRTNLTCFQEIGLLPSTENKEAPLLCLTMGSDCGIRQQDVLEASTGEEEEPEPAEADVEAQPEVWAEAKAENEGAKEENDHATSLGSGWPTLSVVKDRPSPRRSRGSRGTPKSS